MAHYIKNNLQTAPLNKKGTLSEVNLFHSMMETFRFCYGATVIVSETHQNYVGFDAVHPMTGVLEADVTREISDIHIITYSPSRVTARETFLQAKVANNKNGLQTDGTFCFDGDWRQYDLLFRHPELKFPSKKKPYYLCYHPYTHYLQQAVLPSIGSYGVFYRNHKGEVDFAYQPANRLLLSGITTNGASLEMDFSVDKYNRPSIPDLQYTLSADEFEDAVIRQLVGSPITLLSKVSYFPCWYRGGYMHWPNFQHNLIMKGNDDAEVAFTMEGLWQFVDFIFRNQAQFIEDGRGDNIERLHRYYDFEGIHRERKNDRIEEPRRFDEGGERRRLCHGATSLVLINVDNIKI